MNWRDFKGLGIAAIGCLGTLALYAALLAWAASGEGIGFGLLLLGLYLGTRINSVEAETIKRQERMGNALYEQHLELRDKHQETLMALDQLQSDMNELLRRRYE